MANKKPTIVGLQSQVAGLQQTCTLMSKHQVELSLLNKNKDELIRLKDQEIQFLRQAMQEALVIGKNRSRML